ncbi:MAG: CHAP domain-containing protein [Gaiellaceae bacterium]
MDEEGAMEEFVEGPVGVDPTQSPDGTLGPAEVEETPEEEVDVRDVNERGTAAEMATRGMQPERAVVLALRQQGMRENPCGSNRNPYSAYFGFGPQEWCADFVGWSFDQTGNRDRKVPWGHPSAVLNITAWARGRGLIVPTPRRGDIFTYRNGAHTGLVTGVTGTTFKTIEGNTSGPDGRTCWVAQHTRATNDGRYFFVRWPQ